MNFIVESKRACQHLIGVMEYMQRFLTDMKDVFVHTPTSLTVDWVADLFSVNDWCPEGSS